MMTNRDSPSSMAFLTARSPSLTASLIWVSVCLLGPLMSRVTERGFSHFSMNVYFSSPCAKQSQVCLSATCFSSVCTNEFTACFQARFCTDSTLMRSSRTLFHFSQAMTGANIQARCSQPSGFEVFHFNTPALLFQHSNTHQGVLIDQPCMSQAVRSEILHRVHGGTTTGQGQSGREQEQLSFMFNKTQSHW